MRELKIICWSVGIFGLLCLLGAQIFHPGKAAIEHSNLFVKNSFYLFMYNVNLFLLMVPLLMKPGFISVSPCEKKGKAKINFIGLSILMPGTVLLFISLLVSDEEDILFFLIILLGVILVYFLSAYQLITCRSCDKSEMK